MAARRRYVLVPQNRGDNINRKFLDGISWTPATTEAGGFEIKSRIELHEELLEQAAALRARQKEPTDVVKLVQEGREELEERGRPWEQDQGSKGLRLAHRIIKKAEEGGANGVPDGQWGREQCPSPSDLPSPC